MAAAAAPLKPEGEFTAQPAEVWGSEMVGADAGGTRNWADDNPIPQPVAGVTATTGFNASDDWAASVSTYLSGNDYGNLKI